MAIEYLAGNVFTGLSTDTKLTTNVLTGARFVETDTGSFFTWNGSAWLEIPLDHASLLPPTIHVPYNFSFPDAATRTAATYAAGDIGKFIRQIDTNDIYMLINNSPNTFVKVSGSGTGEPNTASNVGSGVGVFKQKTGVDLEFKSIAAASTRVTVNESYLYDTVDIDVDESELNHANIGNVTPDQHHAQLHEATHLHGAGDEIDGDKLDIDYAPANYTPSTNPSEVSSTEELTAHLAGIDTALGNTLVEQTGNKRPVRLATAAALPAYTASGSGIGKFLQANANGALTVDGIGVVANDRVLVKNETGASAIHNGIYVVSNPGDGSNKWVLTRAADYDQDNEVVPGHITQASEGNTNADEIFILTSNGPISVDSSYLYYSTIKVGVTSVTSIAPSANTAVDSILLADFHSAKWIVDIYDYVAAKREASEVLARENNLNTAFAQVNNIGDTINYTISFTSNGVSMLFNILNNESNIITVRVRKLEV